MAADSAASAALSSPAMIDAKTSGAAVPDSGCAFAPSVWGDFFATYVPPPIQRSEEWMRERVEELKRRVGRVFADGEAMGVAEMVTLVDTLEHLGLDSHFREEIAAAISRIHVASEEGPEFAGSDDLHIAATRFRLLRQHGFWVSAEVFDRFRDGAGNFGATDDAARAPLSLYHAAHMAVPAESALDDAIAFTRRHLEVMKGELLRSPPAEQVSRALDHPLPRYTRLLEIMHYVAEYAQEEAHDATLLELARLNSNLMRSLHLKELKALTLWWRDIYDSVNLTYSRDRMVETYLWCCGMIPEEEHSRGRLIFAKTFAILSIVDDTFDVHATIEECRRFNEAFQRWDESAVSILPEYLHTLYIKTLGNFEEFENLLEPHEKYSHVLRQKGVPIAIGILHAGGRMGQRQVPAKLRRTRGAVYHVHGPADAQPRGPHGLRRRRRNQGDVRLDERTCSWHGLSRRGDRPLPQRHLLLQAGEEQEGHG